jgi:hypothetical protein
MKSIAFRVIKGGPGYIRTALVPSTQAARKNSNISSLVMGAFLLLATAAFVCLMLLNQ